jgi:cytochrome c2
MLGRLGPLALAVFAIVSPARATDGGDAKKIFNQRCTACHTFGKGVKVGPDLKGVAARRTRAWFLEFVRSSQKVIESGDPIAASLFEQFKRQRMPDWLDLTDGQLGAIFDWLAANGPELRELDERSAELATAADLELGRALFNGEIAFVNGGLACAGCHTVGGASGGSLGPDLSGVYLRYQDRAMTLFLKQPCFRRLPESASSAFLMPQESFALKSYLKGAAPSGRPAPGPK